MPLMTLVGSVHERLVKNMFGFPEAGNNNLYQCPVCRAVKLKEEIYGTEKAPKCDRCGP